MTSTPIEILATAQSNADPSRVFGLLKDGSTWPRWSMFKAFELERAGIPDPLGVGAIRVFVTRTTRAREQVVEIIPDRQLSYILLSGLPLRNYRADVLLNPGPAGGTLVRWSARFEVEKRWTAWFWEYLMQRVLASTTLRLAKGAEDLSIGAGDPKVKTRSA
jgi:hypothetical protein